MLDPLLQPEIIAVGGALLGLPAVFRATGTWPFGGKEIATTVEQDEWDGMHPWAKDKQAEQVTRLRKDYRVGTVSAETYDIELGLILEGKSKEYPAVQKPLPRPVGPDTVLKRPTGGRVPSWERPLQVEPGPGEQIIPPREPKVKTLFVKRWWPDGTHLLIDAHNIREAVQCQDGTWHYEMLDGQTIGPLLWERPTQPEERVQEVAEMLLNSRGLQSERQKAEDQRKKFEAELEIAKMRWEHTKHMVGSRHERERHTRGRFPF
jgi:hypothetical protein